MNKSLDPIPLWIDGAPVSTSEIREVRNPENGEVVGRFCLAASKEIAIAIESAHRKFAENRPPNPAIRAEWLKGISDGIQNRAGELAHTIMLEAGKPIVLAEIEVQRASQTFSIAAEQAARWNESGENLAINAGATGAEFFGVTRRFPVGPVFAITPFNFPLNLVAHKVAPALAAGNPVILKPSPRTPLTAGLLAEIIKNVGVSAGYFQCLSCEIDQMALFFRDPRVRFVSFTGSAAVGWKLKSECHPEQKVTLELGGNAGVIIHGDSDWKNAIKPVAEAAFNYAGQTCISVQRIFVEDCIYNDFKKLLLDYLEDKMISGSPSDRKVTVGPMIDLAARDRILTWVDEALKLGAKLLTPFKVRPDDRVVRPILLEGLPPDAKISTQEVFGPIACISPYSSFDDALTQINSTPYGLQAGVFTSNLHHIEKAFKIIDAGAVLINQTPNFRVENMPYGGVKQSGFGREGIAYAMHEMSEPKALIVRL